MGGGTTTGTMQTENYNTMSFRELRNHYISKAKVMNGCVNEFKLILPHLIDKEIKNRYSDIKIPETGIGLVKALEKVTSHTKRVNVSLKSMGEFY